MLSRIVYGRHGRCCAWYFITIPTDTKAADTTKIAADVLRRRRLLVCMDWRHAYAESKGYTKEKVWSVVRQIRCRSEYAPGTAAAVSSSRSASSAAVDLAGAMADENGTMIVRKRPASAGEAASKRRIQPTDSGADERAVVDTAQTEYTRPVVQLSENGLDGQFGGRDVEQKVHPTYCNLQKHFLHD